MSISASAKDLRAIARYAYGSRWYERENGGRGNMGLLQRADGRLRVIKFNTHWWEGGTATREMLDSSNRLRAQLLALAGSYGASRNVIEEIRNKLGLARDPNAGTTADSLLSRKVVATVVGMIDRNIWNDIKRTDDGAGDYDLSALQSRSESMEFEAVRDDDAQGLDATDAVKRCRLEKRESWISKTVNEEAVALLKKYKGLLGPGVRKAFLTAIGETVRLCHDPRNLSEPLGRQIDEAAEGRGNGSAGRRFLNVARVNFARALIIFGQTELARQFVEETADGPGAWKSFGSLVDTIAVCRAQLKEPGCRHQFVTELNRGRVGVRGDVLFLTDETLTEPLSNRQIHDRMATAMFTAVNGRKLPAMQPVRDAEQRQALWNDVSGNFGRVFSKPTLSNILKSISGENDVYPLDLIETALAAWKEARRADGMSGRLAAAFRKAGVPDKDAGKLVPQLQERLLAAVFVSRLQPHKAPLTIEAAVRWFEDHPAALVQVNRGIDLADGESVKTDVKAKIVEMFRAVKGDMFADHLYVMTAREYDSGTLTVGGRPISTKPSAGFVLPGELPGVDTPERKAFVEELRNTVRDPMQLRFVSFMLSMSAGLPNILDAVSVRQNPGLKPETEIVELFGDQGLVVLGNENRRLGDIRMDDGGALHLRLTAGTGLKLLSLAGVDMSLDFPLVNNCYDIEITVPAGQPVEKGVPDFTVDMIGNSDANLLA